MIYNLKTPSDVTAGMGSLSQVERILTRVQAKTVLVCTDKGIEASGLLEGLTCILGDHPELQVRILDALATEPSYLDVQEALDALGEFYPQIIIAMGGGSVMDAAKLLSVLVGADYSIQDLLEAPGKAKKQVKTVMIPTTCGTGSEATCNAIVAVPEKSVKVGIVSSEMIPDYVLLDPQMLRRLPPKIIAATGVDALAHVVECYTSNKATALSDIFAMEGAKRIFHNLVKAYREPANMEAKEAMLIGAFCGGVAITGSGTTAVHALSYPLGGKFHIPHGISNAVLFAAVMEVNREACMERLAGLCDGVFPEYIRDSAEEKAGRMIEKIREIVKAVEIPTDLSGFGVTKEHMEFLVQSGSEQKRLLNNNRKNLTLEDIRGIYEQVVK